MDNAVSATSTEDKVAVSKNSEFGSIKIDQIPFDFELCHYCYIGCGSWISWLLHMLWQLDFVVVTYVVAAGFLFCLSSVGAVL